MRFYRDICRYRNYSALFRWTNKPNLKNDNSSKTSFAGIKKIRRCDEWKNVRFSVQ